MAALSNSLAEALHGRYVLERVLGRGGMATVYLARDLKHDRLVALKVLDPDAAASLGPARFQREIRVAARLHHPHILSVYDSGEAADRLWFTMPYVRGESLRERLRREGILPIDEALRITRQAAQALSYAHKEGVIHRDVKPENLLLDRLEALAREPGLRSAGLFRIDPNFDPIREHPRFVWRQAVGRSGGRASGGQTEGGTEGTWDGRTSSRVSEATGGSAYPAVDHCGADPPLR